MHMELQLELALSCSSGQGFDPDQDCGKTKKKRSFDEAFLGFKENVDVNQTLPLLTWDENEAEQGKIDGELSEEKEDLQKLAISNREADFVVGWPPVKSWRKQFCHRGRATNFVNVENSGRGGGCGRRLNSMYVKVKMEGVGITRKVDLTIHNSYHTLAAKLIALFGKCEENIEKYELTYQDEEGDWMLARDVPWETFTKSVQRLKLRKNGY